MNDTSTIIDLVWRMDQLHRHRFYLCLIFFLLSTSSYLMPNLQGGYLIVLVHILYYMIYFYRELMSVKVLLTDPIIKTSLGTMIHHHFNRFKFTLFVFPLVIFVLLALNSNDSTNIHDQIQILSTRFIPTLMLGLGMLIAAWRDHRHFRQSVLLPNLPDWYK